MKQAIIFNKSSKGAGSSPQNHRKIIVILGPTASGKSDLAVKIALRLGSGRAKKLYGLNGTEIISADSRQIYKGLNVGSGKITKKEMRGVPHYLLDVASPKKTFTVANYQKLTREAIQKIWLKNKLPIICGGTGFYIRAVIDGLVIPDVKPNHKLRKKLKKKSASELFKSLKEKDPKRAKNIDRQNCRRLIRALEIVESLGKVPKSKTEPIEAGVLMIGVKKSNDELKNLIKKRLDKRLKEDLITEVKKLHAPPTGGGLSWKRLEDFGLEYRYVAQFLQNKISKKEMIEILEREIYRYAKRQMTWFKRDKRIRWIKNEREAVKLIDNFLE